MGGDTEGVGKSGGAGGTERDSQGLCGRGSEEATRGCGRAGAGQCGEGEG
jgi:hypothetical protein